MRTVPRGRLRPVLVAWLGGLLAVTALTPVPSAAGAPTPSISRRLLAPVVLSGDAVTVVGAVSSGSSGADVALQRATSRGWVTVKRGSTTTDGRYSLAVRPKVGSWRYRVYGTASPGRRTASKPVTARVESCYAGSAPAYGSAVWFSNPHRRGSSQTAAGISKLLCAAAPGASVDIAMYFVRTGQADTERMLSSLRKVVRHRGVKATVILEGRLYTRKTALYPSLVSLRRYARVLLCDYGCHDERAFPGPPASPTIMHHKFLTVSDTVWRAGADPVVLSSSANWSQTQLTTRWQSTVVRHDDDKLYAQMRAQWLAMVACASSAGCASWNGRLAALGLAPSAHAMTNKNGLWTLPAGERLGDPGKGAALTVSPIPTGDPLVSALDAATCTPQHRTVRVAHMFITTGRWRVMRALQRLKDLGCDVRIQMSYTLHSAESPGLVELRKRGLRVTCIPRMHDKFIIMDAVDRQTAQPVKTVWIGSQALGYKALRVNDEAVLRVSTRGATGTALTGNTRLYDTYRGHWTRIQADQRECPGL